MLMMNRIKKIPMQLSAVMLGMAALGNLWQNELKILHTVCGILAFILAAVILLRAAVLRDGLKKDFAEGATAGINGTFSMGWMILSTYLHPYLPEFAFGIWITALILHIALIIWFTGKYVFRFSLSQVYPSWFIVYVGIAVFAVTSPVFQQQAAGAYIWRFAVAAFPVTAAVMMIRYHQIPAGEKMKPLICISAAPASLCTSGYLQTAEKADLRVLLILMIPAIVIYIYVLILMMSMITRPFVPAMATFTFPLVISASAARQAVSYLELQNIAFLTWKPVYLLLQTMVWGMKIMAGIVVSVIFARFMVNISSANRLSYNEADVITDSESFCREDSK